MVRARISFDDLRGRFDKDRAHHDACIAASGCDGAGARLRRISGGGDAEPSPRPPPDDATACPQEVPPEVDETIFIEGPRDVGHHYDLLPQFAAVRPPHVATTARHLLLNLVGRELSFTKTRDGFERCGEWYEAVFDTLVPPEARARFSEVERPHLNNKIAERLDQTIGSRETEVPSTNTPRDTPKSVEHVGPRPGRLPLPGRPLNKSHVGPTKGTKTMAAPREGESDGGLV